MTTVCTVSFTNGQYLFQRDYLDYHPMMKTTLAVVCLVERTGTTYCTIVNGMDSPQYIADDDLTTDDKNTDGSLRYELYDGMHVYVATLSFVLNNIGPFK